MSIFFSAELYKNPQEYVKISGFTVEVPVEASAGLTAEASAGLTAEASVEEAVYGILSKDKYSKFHS